MSTLASDSAALEYWNDDIQATDFDFWLDLYTATATCPNDAIPTTQAITTPSVVSDTSTPLSVQYPECMTAPLALPQYQYPLFNQSFVMENPVSTTLESNGPSASRPLAPVAQPTKYLVPSYNERIYKCGWKGCEKAYKRLGSLNDHIIIYQHGAKRKPTEFRAARDALRKEKQQERKLRYQIAERPYYPAAAMSWTDEQYRQAYAFSQQRPWTIYSPNCQSSGPYTTPVYQPYYYDMTAYPQTASASSNVTANTMFEPVQST